VTTGGNKGGRVGAVVSYWCAGELTAFGGGGIGIVVVVVVVVVVSIIMNGSDCLQLP